ncbi:hypothetical protein EB75_20625 [Mycobacterium sp. ST-F2]|uniref:DUF6529 family protein n=1 Tax=Mycobacterium sp. ST-F2 TaxID=1490484 RepID=UPI00093FAA70|nr:DUF6529 family protein [Mycobacterium sp. ST-F2]OKH80445.1 hypothetical protein EB75_20625 [Mycobacterium sp. ST-F2]
MSSDYPPDAPTQRAQVSSSSSGLLLALVAGALVAVGLGVYGTMHDPTFFSVNFAGFSSGLYAKAWLATIAAVLGLFQVFSALVMYGKLPLAAPSWIGAAHVWSGRLAVLATVPVAVHCLYAVGFQTGDTRVLTHSLLGCFFYGAFVAKMLVLSRKGVPGWALPVLGGAVFTGLIYLWLTSALWLFAGQGLKF